MKWVLLAVLAAIVLHHDASAQRFTNLTAGKLGELCVSQNRGQSESCIAYLDGIADGIGFYQRLLPQDGSRGGKLPGYICIPGPTTGPQLREAYVAWLRAHKDAERDPAVQASMLAFRDTYKCQAEPAKP